MCFCLGKWSWSWNNSQSDPAELYDVGGKLVDRINTIIVIILIECSGLKFGATKLFSI